VFAGREAADFAYSLLRLPRAGSGQVGGRFCLSINLNLDRARARFLGGKDHDAGAGKWSTPDIARRGALRQVVVEITRAQVAASRPTDRHHAGVVIVEPPGVMRDAQDATP